MIATVDGVALHHDDVGRGPAVLFVHGFPHGRRFWAPQLDALAGTLRCLAPDLRGFGDTPAHPPLTLDRHADDLAALLDHAGLARAVVCGLSMGGYVALALWRRHPHRVRALVLADTRATPDTDEQRARRDATIALAGREGAAAVADAQLPGAVGRTTRARRPERAAALYALMATAPVAGIVGAAAAMRDRPDSTPTLATITVPTLVIVGDEDAITPLRDARALHAGIAGSELAIVPEAGHCSSWERPDVFNAALARFVAGIPTDSPSSGG